MTSTIATPLASERDASVRTRGGIRALSPNDLPQLTDLYERVFGGSVHGSASFLRRVFFESPWLDDALCSLAYENDSGQIVACLGVMPRPMRFRGREVRAAIGHHFMVDSTRKGTLAAVELARRFLRGPQDLALAEGSDFSRRIWEFIGGSVCLLYSFCWTRTLRPAQFALNRLKQRGLPSAAAMTLDPACRALDATLSIVPRAFGLDPPATLSDDLDPVTMLACLSAFERERALKPIYDAPSLAWLVETLKEKRHRGTLHKVAVRTHSGRPLGWYLYHLGASSVAEVLQVGGGEDTIRLVLDHLFHHAWQRGAVAATGPMDPSLFNALSDKHCTFHRPDNCWMLIHSQDETILNSIHAGDAFLTRLEGEWWITS